MLGRDTIHLPARVGKERRLRMLGDRFSVWRGLCVVTCVTGLGAALGPAHAQVPAAPLVAAEALQRAFTEVAESVSRSVVAMRVESRRKLTNPFDGLPFGEWFSPGPRGDQVQIQRGTGSGVVIRGDGYILTNKHVVEDASRVELVFQDGRLLVGKTVGIDDATDLAVVKVQAKDLIAARFADSSKTRPGEWAVAIGSPFGLDYTVTVGVVSAVGRGGMGANEIEDYLQTDASINPGNSGGPLVNLRGEVLGINTMIVGGGTGIGFAIHSNLARLVAEQLIDKGSVRRAYIGVGFQPLTPDLAKHFGVEGKGGALISSIATAGPADKAGVKAGDVVVSLDGKVIKESRDLSRLLFEKSVGVKVTLGVVRDKQALTLTVVTIDRPGAKPVAAKPPARVVSETRDLGLQLEALTPERARRLGYRDTQGVLVAGVVSGGPADRAGLARGDLIVEADRSAVQSPADVDAALRDGSALLRVMRREAASYVVLTREE
jgi:Do/DeqQ family serine protease